MVGIVCMAVGNACALLLAHTLLRSFRTGRGDLDLVAFLVLHMTITSGVVLLAGLAGALAPLPLGSVSAVGLAGLLAARRHVPLVDDLRAVVRACQFESTDDRFERVARAAGIALAGVLLATVLLHTWFLPPNWVDLTSYHLPRLAEWIRAGRIFAPATVDLRAYFPAGFQLLQTWWVVFLHHDVVIELAGVEMYLLAGAAVFALGRNLGLTAGRAALGGLLMLSVPAAVAIAPSASNDIAVAALVLSAVALLYPLDQPGRRARLALGAIVLLLGAGIKPTVVTAAPAFLGVGGWRFRIGEPQAGRWVRAGILMVALALGIFWYGRNAVLFGNPFYPALAGMAGMRGEYQQGTPGLTKLRANIQSFTDDRLYDREVIRLWLTRVSGWGWVVLPCGLPAILLALRRSGEFRVVTLGFLGALVVVFTVADADLFNMRYLLWFPGLACVAVAFALGASWPRVAHRAYVALVALGCGLNLVATLVPQHVRPASLRASVARDWRHRSALDIEGTGPLLIPEAEPLAALGSGHGNLYALYGPGFSRRVTHLRPASAEDLVSQMRALRLRYVYALELSTYTLSPGRAVDEEELLADALHTGALEQVEGNLYALR